ncbi:hypothetical protein ACFLW4_00530 [Chloroflexota bacterium]
MGCIIGIKTMIRNVIRPLVFLALMAILLLATPFAVAANGDFSFRLYINGDDFSELETVVIDPEREMTIDLHIFDITRDVTLEKVSVAVTFAGQTLHTLNKSLGNLHITAGEDYREQISVNIREALMTGDLSLVTGIYQAVIKLEYTADDQKKVWSEAKNVKILGNPVRTPLGAAGIVISGGTISAILILLKSLIAPGLPAGTTMPVSTPIRSSPRLYNLVAERLEPTTRGRVMGSIVKAAKGRIVKERCPICGTRLKHRHCYTCKKPTREVRQEYVDRMKALSIQGSELLASGQVATLDDLCSRLGISAKLGTDIIATLRHAKLVKARVVAGKIMGKAITVGLGSGLSTVLWITVGGLVVLSSSALVATLVAFGVIPVVLTKSLQMRARRTLKKKTK